LTQVIKAAATVLVNKKKELHISSLAVLPLVLVLFNIFEVVYRVVNKSYTEFFTLIIPFFHQILYAFKEVVAILKLG
jgi:hypothetical protein